MKFAKSPPWLVELFRALQPEAGGELRQMFGYPCAFAKGNMFSGLFGDGMFVRIPPAERPAGWVAFTPVGGRPMKDYAMIPPALFEDEEEVLRWMRRAREVAEALPPKAAKKKRVTSSRR